MPRKIIGTFIGIVVIIYGIKSVYFAEIVAYGRGIFGAGWETHGTPAIIQGIAIILFGLYMLYLTYREKE